MPQEVILFGSQRFAPTLPTIFNLIADPNGTNSDSNNDVRLYFDWNNTLAPCTVNLPSISTFQGKWNVRIYISVTDDLGNWNHPLYCAASDTIWNNGGNVLTPIFLYSGVRMFSIGNENNWLVT